METTLNGITTWSPAQKWVLRFFFIFFIIFIFFDPNAGVPLSDMVYDYYIAPMHSLVVWSGVHIFHLAKPITAFTGGSGDTTYDYIVLFYCVLFSVMAAVIWSLLEKNPRNYDRLYYWLLVILRFYLGITMISYGAVKVVKLQFPEPGLGRLLEPYGNSSPM